MQLATCNLQRATCKLIAYLDRVEENRAAHDAEFADNLLDECPGRERIEEQRPERDVVPFDSNQAASHLGSWASFRTLLTASHPFARSNGLV